MPTTEPIRRRIPWRAVLAVSLLFGVLAAGAGMPWFVRRVIVEQASAFLRTRVDVGDVDLFLPWGTVVLNKVAVWSPPQDTPSGAPDSPLSQPILAWRRLLVDVDWLPLFSRTIRLGKIALDGPVINIDRLSSGEINAVELVNNALRPAADAPPTPPPTPTPIADPASEWRYGVDRLAITGGRLGFRDFVVGQIEPVLVRIPDIRAEQLSLSPDLYGDPTAAGLHILLDEGTIDVKVRASLPQKGLVAHVTVQAQRLPLHRSRLYVPVVGWSELEGELDADVQYDLDTGAHHTVSAAATLRDVVIKVPDVPDAALTTESLFVRVDPLDLQKRSVTIAAVELDKAWLGVWTTGDNPLLPVFGRRAGSEPPASTTATPASAPEDAPAPEPWQWQLASLRLRDSMLHVVGPQGPVDIDVNVSADRVSSAPEPGTLSVALATGGGTLGVDGRVRAQPPAFSGSARAGALSLPELIVASNAVTPNPLQQATLSMDLAIDAGISSDGTATEPRDVRVRGSLSLAEPLLRVGTDAPTEVAAGSIALNLGDLALPGVLAVVDPGNAPEANAGNVEVAGTVTVDGAAISLTAGTGPRVTAESLGVTIGAFTLAGTLAGPAGVRPETRPDFGDLRVAGNIAVTNSTVALPGANPIDIKAGTLALDISSLGLPALLAGTQGTHRRDAGDVQFTGGLEISNAQVNPANGAGLQVAVKNLAFTDTAFTLSGLLAPADAKTSGDVRARTNLRIGEPRLGLTESKDLQVSARSLSIGLTNADLPGLLATQATTPESSMRIALREVRLDAPSVRVTRTANGLVLGPPQQAPTPAATPPETPSGEVAAPTPEPSGDPDAGRVLDVSLASLKLTQGRVVLVDRSVQPEFNGSLSQINVDLRNARLPGPDIGQFRVSADTPGDGTILLSGSYTPARGDLRFESSDVALTPYNPYAKAYSPYRVTDGSLFVSSSVTSEGERYDTNTTVTLQDFDIAGSEGESLFAKQFGIPLSTALALLTDTSGKIALTIPAQVDAAGTAVAVGPIITDVVRRALVNALAAPLKLVGSLAGGSGTFTPPAPIAFHPGRADLAPSGAEAVDHLGTLLGERPALGVALSSDATTADIRWLREQALRARWEEAGVLGRVAMLTQVGARGRVEEFLAARVSDDAAELDPEDAAQLDAWLAEIPPVPAEQLRALAAERLARTAAALRDAHAIDTSRIRVDDPDDTIAEGTPVVDMGLKRASRLFAAAAAGTE